MERKQQLLCTFTTPPGLSLTLDYIKTYYQISNDKVFLYREKSEVTGLRTGNILLVYNIDGNLRSEGLAKSTILVHRKKQFNSFYTINGLNYLIETVNNGVLDKTYQIDWENYKNKLITVNGDQIKIVEINFEKTLYI